MSHVEEALNLQRKIWTEVAHQIIRGGMAGNLPSKPPRKIILFGVGSSLFSAKLASLALTREMSRTHGRSHVQVIACSSISVGLKIIPERGDWVFAVSHRGKTPATLKALEICSQSGAFTVLVAAQGTLLPSSARFLLPTSPLEKCEPHTMGMTSAICALTVLILGNIAADSWHSLSERSNPDLKLFQSQVGAGPTLLLGEWEGEWIAREISLKLTEMAQIRVPIYGTEEFFHGPQVYSQLQKEKENIWYISSSEDSRHQQVLKEGRIGQWVAIPGDHCLSWVDALVEMQWRVLGVALNLGKNPDGSTC